MHTFKYPLILLIFCIAGFTSLFGNENGEDEFYILPDFVVTDDDDKGYYSANTLAGTRTNELTKNIPMTISTVNAEMIEDFKMKTLEDLGNFVPSIEAEGNVYNNNEIRFRGLLTKNQLYEFMPRYSPLDWYNVGRSDIIRGANSLIYGQADPGGKVNVISKTAMLNKNKGSAVVEIGDKSWHKVSYDWNEVLGDNTAARIMLVDKHREFDANYKYQSFSGASLEFLHNPSPTTRLRLHLETGEADRSLIGGTFKVGQTPTGLPNGIVADPKLADLISDELLEEIVSYSDVNDFDGSDYNSIYPVVGDDVFTVYGFIDQDSEEFPRDGILGKNFTDTNNNGTWDTASKIIAFYDGYESPGSLSFGDTTANEGDEDNPITVPWNPINDLAVSTISYDPLSKTFENRDPSTFVGLPSNADASLIKTQYARNKNGDFLYYGDTNGDGIEGINPVTNEEDKRVELFKWVDTDENGKLSVGYNQVEGIYTVEEHVTYIDDNNNGRFDFSYENIDSTDSNSANITTGDDDAILVLNPSIVGQNAVFTLIDEDFKDYNKDSIYNDADYASGGLQVRANSPNIWGMSPAGGGLVPDFIDNRQDIRNLFKGIDYSNSGTGFGPDAYSKKSFDYLIGDIDHSYSDNFSVKAAFAFEDLVDEQLSSGWSANQLNFSSGYGITVRYPTLRSINSYNNNPNNTGPSPFEAVLVDLTNANYAHKALDNINAIGIEGVRTALKVAYGQFGNLSNNNVSFTAPSDIVLPDNEVLTDDDEMIDYFVNEFLDISDADTTLEKYYELGKFSGRVKDFLKRSKRTSVNGEGPTNWEYTWGNTPQGGGRSLGDLLYDALTGSTDLGAPTSTATNQLFNLDRYINVPKYRAELNNYSNANLLIDDNYKDLEDLTWENPFNKLLADPLLPDTIQNLIDQNIPSPLIDYLPYYIPAEKFTLNETGERLIYDAIPDWLIKGFPDRGQPREMIALPYVEIANTNEDNNGIDGFVDVNDEDEVELQKRALAKKIYKVLVENRSDPDSDNEFWEATNEVYNIFKEELHPESDYSYMWEGTIQQNLLTTLDAIVEDGDYLSDNSQFIDTNGDGVRDILPSLVKSNVEILQPFIKRQWKKSTNKDMNRSARITFNYNEENDIIPGKQQFLFGIDLDNRDASKIDEQLVSYNVRTWGDANNLYLNSDILSDYVILDDIIYNNELDANFDYNISGHQYDPVANWLSNGRIPLDEENIAQMVTTYKAVSKVKSNALWAAASGSYFNGKLRTLFGVRRDNIKTESEYSRFTLRSANPEIDEDGNITEVSLENEVQEFENVIYSPSLGGLYWITKNFAVFGNYSESVISPNGFQFDVFGKLTPPETGKGREIGFKLSTQDNVLNGQLTFFSIDKKNEQRQNISWPMLASIYPAFNPDGTRRYEPYDNGELPTTIWDYDPYRSRDGEYLRDAEGRILTRATFEPKGYRVADESVRSEGIELDLYYNPTSNISIFLGYAYLETLVLESALETLEGLPTAGTSDHNVNFTAKYSIKEGKYKGLQFGLNQKYRSAALLSHYFVDLDGDNQADYFPRDVIDPKSNVPITLQPRYNTLWLEDQFNTDVFIKWAGKLKKHHPWTVIQLNVNNIFNRRSLISTGLNNARYTEGRNIVLSAGVYF